MRVSHQVPWRTLASACVISGLVLSTNVATFADENGESAPLTVATQSDPQENPQNQEGTSPLGAETVAPVATPKKTTAHEPLQSPEGSWIYSGVWQWKQPDGTLLKDSWARINGSTYYFDANGTMASNWFRNSDSWFYASASGALTTGWLNDRGTWYYLDSETGQMVTGQKQVGNETYFFNASGAMLTGWVEMSDGWHYATTFGVEVHGWLNDRGTWYYLDPSTGIMQTGRQTINGTTYVFNASGAMSTGWTKLKEGWRYSDSNGVEYLGWLGLNGVWYYLDPSNGVMVENASKSIGGRTYTFDANGTMKTGWVEMSDGWHYATTLGDEVHGWLNDRGTWYYLDPVTGIMATGERTIGGNSYEFASNGAMLTGWYKRADGWHYRKPSGEVGLGWQRVGLDWYYLDPVTGIMATGERTIGGNSYEFASNGAMLTGWYKRADGWHYRKPSGEVGLGWQRVGLDWYYLEPSTGIMANAGRTIDGKWYNFLSSGQWVNYQAPAGYLQPTMSIQSLGWATNTLTYGMNGVKVRIVQQRLGIWHTMKLASVDSSFMSAVRNFQRRAGLPQTGVVDERTWNAMGTGYSWYVDQYQVAPTVSVSASRSEHIEAMISYALAQVGSPYTWGGAGPYNLGFDCSGLVLQALHAGGLDPQPINVLKHAWPDYRTSQELYNYSGFQYLPLSQRQRGDLIFYTSGGVVTHVSLYLGNERVVHTDWMGNPARVDSVWTSYGYSNTAPWVIRPFP